ncbi:MAG: HAMP domain-containing histidine kinase [Lachnospiraceae bacterium]|nr:HAMP domain-containing histidine kinase [Lachnospiraceae bacterium]
MKKIINWFKRNYSFILIEGLAIILAAVMINTSYKRYLKAFSNSEFVWHFGYGSYKETHPPFEEPFQGKDHIEEVIKNTSYILMDKELNEKLSIGEKKHLPYCISFQYYNYDDELIGEEYNGTNPKDCKKQCYELAQKICSSVKYELGETVFLHSSLIGNFDVEVPEGYAANGAVWIDKKVWNKIIDAECDLEGKELERVRNEMKDDVAYIKFAVCVDLSEYVLNNDLFITQTVITVVFFQTIALLIWALRKYQKRRLKKLNNTKDLFVNAMAHEMKTPAAIIINSVECIKEGVRPDKKKNYQNNIFNEAEHVKKLVDYMLKYTRVIDSDYVIDKQKLCINDIAKEVFDRFKVMADSRNIKMDMIENGSFKIDGDRKLMGMVIDNYISNAVKHCVEHGKIIVTVDENCLTVYNEGDTINDKDISGIWDPMYNVDKARTKLGASSGMGLAICARIIRLHGLKYNVENVIDGVKFSMKR